MPEINLDYSGRDYTATLEWLYNLLRQELPEYTDFNHSDPGIAQMRLLARQLDQANFYVDEVFAEGYWSSARFMQSLIELGKLVGCLPKLSNAASTELAITRTSEPYYLTQMMFIPKGTPFYRSDSLPYVCLEDISIPVGTNSVTVDVLQGELRTITLTADDFDYHDLTAHLKYNLGKDVAARSVKITHGPASIAWSEVESFYRSGPNDYHFRLELQADSYGGESNTVFLVLGDGSKGSSYPGAEMTVSYVVTGGPVGNAGAGTITELPGEFPVMITITNPASATGGSLPESISDYRSRLPFAVTAQDRGVTEPDYVNVIKKVAGVGDCQVIDRNRTQYLPWEYISIFVLPSGGGVVSPELERAILATLTEKGGLGGWEGRYIMQSATAVPIAISCRLSVVAGYSVNSVRSAVTQAISDLFSVRYGVIGADFSFYNLNLAVSRVPGVNWVEFDSPTINVTIADGCYPTVASINITVV